MRKFWQNLLSVIVLLLLCQACNTPFEFDFEQGLILKEVSKENTDTVEKVPVEKINDSLTKAAESVVIEFSEPVVPDFIKPGPVEKEEEYTGPYKLKVGDLIEISVLDEPEMTREVRVIPDGTIPYLLIGEIEAEGKTIKALRESISISLTKYFVEPIVSVITKELVHEEGGEEEEETFAALVGALNSPGKYKLSEGDRLIDVVAAAGGLLFINDFMGGRSVANLKASYISRDGVTLPVDFDKLLRLGDMSQNIEIADGDFVYIADAETYAIYVLGEVNDPQLVPYNRDISLVEALARTGGFTVNAQRSKVIVVRGGAGVNKALQVDVEGLLLGEEGCENVMLQSGDVIFVPEQGLSEYSRYISQLSSFANIILDGYSVREAVRFPKLNR
jgi:polysaccharide biosynthesis/export protein